MAAACPQRCPPVSSLPAGLQEAHTAAHAGVLLCGRADGQLEAWDLLERTHEPAMVLSVCPVALSSLAFATYELPVEALGGAMRRLLAAGRHAVLNLTPNLTVQAHVKH